MSGVNTTIATPGNRAHEPLVVADAPDLITALPGPNARALIARDAAVVTPSHGRVYPLVPARAEGMVIEDVDGNRFLDFNAGIAVNATGHCHPHVVAAVEQQARTLLHYCSSDWYIPSYIELCERLAASAPVKGSTSGVKVYLGNSGTEAVEGGIKLARQHTGRPNVIAFFGAFHGRSLGSLALTASKAKYRSGFGPFMPGVLHAPYGDFDYIESVLFQHLTEPQDVAAIAVEPIQGEGGYVVPPTGWLAALRALCDEHGIMLVADEVQSGAGRTGKMWAIEHDGVEPDILLAGKGLASGLPLSAVMARSEVMDWTPGKHGSTFGGNPVACAAALATLDLLDAGLLANAATVGELMLRELREMAARHSSIRDVRGRGLMIGIEFDSHDTAAAVEQRAFQEGLLVLTCGASSLRLAPPLVVDAATATRALGMLDAVVTAVGA